MDDDIGNQWEEFRKDLRDLINNMQKLEERNKELEESNKLLCDQVLQLQLTLAQEVVAAASDGNTATTSNATDSNASALSSTNDTAKNGRA